MRNLITIYQKIGARDTWSETQLESLNLSGLATKLLEKYREALNRYHGYIPRPEEMHFFYITDQGTAQELDLNQPLAPLLDIKGSSVFWQLEPPVTFYTFSTKRPGIDTTKRKLYWSLSTIDSDGWLPIVHNRIWGYIDEKGSIKTEPCFVEAFIQTEGFALMKLSEGDPEMYSFITVKGDHVVLPANSIPFPFSEGYARIRIRDRWGFIDKSYTVHKPVVAIKAQFEGTGDFSENLAPVKVNSTWGYIDKNGAIRISPKFQFAKEFSEGLAPVYNDGAWGYINKSGYFAIKPSFENAWQFNGGLAAVQVSGKWGFIDKNERIIIEPKFDDANIFSQGLANVSINGQWGFINKTGEFIINPQFTNAGPFSKSLAPVMIHENLGWIDTSGRYVWQPQN